MDWQIFLAHISFLGIIITQFREGLSAPTNFQQIIFTQTWPKTECFSWKRKKASNQCNLPKQEEWTVHGIWPSNCNKKGPNYCGNDLPFEIKELSSIQQDLQVKWTNVHITKNPAFFWKHEWEKHGTCGAVLESMNTPKKYFQTGIQLHEQFNIRRILRVTNILPGGTYPVKQILDIFLQELGVYIQVMCYENSTNMQYLHEIRICLDKSLNLMDCNGMTNFSTNCDATINVNYPKTVPPIELY